MSSERSVKDLSGPYNRLYGAGDGNRTHVRSLGSFYTAIVRRPLDRTILVIIHNPRNAGTAARHGTPNTYTADVRASANPSHPTALPYIAIHYRPPTSELTMHTHPRTAPARNILCDRIPHEPSTKRPRRPQRFVERNYPRPASRHVQQIQQHFYKIIRLHRATRHADDRNSRARLPGYIRNNQAGPSRLLDFPPSHEFPPYVEHAPGDTTARAFGARRSIQSQVVIACPVTSSVPKLPSTTKMPHEFVAVFVRQERIVKFDSWNPGIRSEHKILDARLSRGGRRNSVAVATKSRSQPQLYVTAHN
jgi:hypothetical protein